MASLGFTIQHRLHLLDSTFILFVKFIYILSLSKTYWRQARFILSSNLQAESQGKSVLSFVFLQLDSRYNNTMLTLVISATVLRVMLHSITQGINIMLSTAWIDTSINSHNRIELITKSDLNPHCTQYQAILLSH